MGLLSAYLHNVNANRGAKLAFAINQREEREAEQRIRQAQQEEMIRSLNSGTFGNALSAAWGEHGGLGSSVSDMPIPSSAFKGYPPKAPEPPPGVPSMGGSQAAGTSASLSRVLERMKGTSGRMAQGTGILGGAARPAMRAQ
jgi:hypothetical protein